jgi:hypothetical protein
VIRVTGERSKDELIAELDAAVRETLGFFEGPAGASKARVDDWGTWEVLLHFLYWHHATAWCITSVNAGGPPWKLPGTADEVNAVSVKFHEGESFADLLAQLQRAQQRMLRAAGAVEDLDAIAVIAADGRNVSIRQRLEAIPRHWRSHVDGLKAAMG